jgi:uncharacterized protein
MQKKEIIVIIILFLLAFSFSYYVNLDNNSEISQVCFEEKCFDIEIADSDEERQTGLMFRESLAENAGMLFIFEGNGVYGFWMKNTLIPLDIIWINSDMVVVFIKENALPCIEGGECIGYGPNQEALYVLEVNSGVVEEIGLSIGEKVRFK